MDRENLLHCCSLWTGRTCCIAALYGQGELAALLLSMDRRTCCIAALYGQGELAALLLSMDRENLLHCCSLWTGRTCCIAALYGQGNSLHCCSLWTGRTCCIAALYGQGELAALLLSMDREKVLHCCSLWHCHISQPKPCFTQ